MYSVHTRALYVSKNGRKSYQTGYSDFKNWRSYNTAFRHAVWNGVYLHNAETKTRSGTGYTYKLKSVVTITIARTKGGHSHQVHSKSTMSRDDRIEQREKVLSSQKIKGKDKTLPKIEDKPISKKKQQKELYK